MTSLETSPPLEEPVVIVVDLTGELDTEAAEAVPDEQEEVGEDDGAAG